MALGFNCSTSLTCINSKHVALLIISLVLIVLNICTKLCIPNICKKTLFVNAKFCNDFRYLFCLKKRRKKSVLDVYPDCKLNAGIEGVGPMFTVGYSYCPVTYLYSVNGTRYLSVFVLIHFHVLSLFYLYTGI